MTFLWFHPKRVWMQVFAVSSEQPDRYSEFESIRIEWGRDGIPEWDTLKTYCNPSEYRFVERISQCTDCFKREPLEDRWNLLPQWVGVNGIGWEAQADIQTLYSNSYAPFVIAERCKWCVDHQDAILARKQKETENEMRVRELRDYFSRMRTTELAGKLCRCTICATLFWSTKRRHHKRNVCSLKCNEVLSDFIERSRNHINVIECSNDYIQTLLGGISHPSLIECKRTQIKLSRVLREKRKHDNQNQRTEPRNGTLAGPTQE